MKIAVVGAGKVGTALAVLLQRAGHEVVAVSGAGQATTVRARRFLRGVEALPAADAASRGELVVVGTPDDRIRPVCEEISEAGGFRTGQWVLHVSGAARLDALEPARRAGARTLAVHPLMTFPTVESAIERIPASAMAATAEDADGQRLGESLARDLGATSFPLADEARPLYHAAAVFASNYVVAVLALAEKLFRAAGLEDPVPLFLPLSRVSVENVGALGATGALTGPGARGDAGTVSTNLEAVAGSAPDAIHPYVALADVVLDLAASSGRLTSEARSNVEEVLARWR